jgi:hypothetical protein
MRTGLSRHANASLSLGIKSAGKGFARARDRAAFCPRDRPSAVAETGDSAPVRSNVAANRELFQRPQETGLSRDCVVGPVGLYGRSSINDLTNSGPIFDPSKAVQSRGSGSPKPRCIIRFTLLRLLSFPFPGRPFLSRPGVRPGAGASPSCR